MSWPPPTWSEIKAVPWVWVLPTAVSLAWVLLLGVAVTVRVTDKHSLWPIIEPPLTDSYPVSFKVEELKRNWGDTRPEYRIIWIWYRTPLLLYLWTIEAVLGLIFCVTVRWKWRYHRWFKALAAVTLVVVCFHLWAGRQMPDFRHGYLWGGSLLPCILLMPFWGGLLIRESISRKRSRSTGSEPTSPIE